MINHRKTQLLLLIILLLYVVLAAGYGLVVPLFEAPDEHHHFFTIRSIAENGTLPTTDSSGELARQEAAQPPLYYLISVPLFSLIDSGGAEEQLWANPSGWEGESPRINVNMFVHTKRESLPWQGWTLAAHLARGLSTVIGLGTLLAIYFSGRLLWPETPAIALLATALVAFLPQFGFLHGAITNDVLVIFLCSFTLWQLLWLWLNKVTTARLLLLGGTIGLAILSKMSGLLLLALVLLVLAMIIWRDQRLLDESAASDTSGNASAVDWVKRLLWSYGLVVVPALLIAGWLLWRNWNLYGDITAANQFVMRAGGNRHYTLRQVRHDLDRVAMSAIGYFGWMNVQAPRWLYLVWAGILSLAGGGWLFAAWQKHSISGENLEGSSTSSGSRRLIAIWMGAWVLLVFAAWLRFMIQTPADQGRLLFPALLPVSLFMARGLVSWRQRWLPWLIAFVALATSVYSLLVVIPGAYDKVDLLTEQEIPQEVDRFLLDMGHGIELVAVENLTEEIRPGEWAWVDLYWRAAEPPTEAPFERLGLYGRENAQVGGQMNYHGGGSYPANQWPAGQVVKDTVGVQLVPDAELPAQLRVLMRIDQEREPVEIARVKAVPFQWPKADGEALANLGGEIDLLDASFSPRRALPGSVVDVELQWQVDNTPGRELTTFIHLGDPTQTPIAQGDGPALNGDYPTSLWAKGEVINDRYVLTVPDDLPQGTYPIHIGFYEPQSGARLPVQVEGQAQPHDAYFLGWLDVKTAE